MKYELRDYQRAAVEAGVGFLKSKSKSNELDAVDGRCSTGTNN